METPLPLVTVIIPTFNEEKFIDRILVNIGEQDYPQDRMEVLFVDGNSHDRTGELIKATADKHPNIHLLINERQYVPFALNLGISEAKGEVIMIMGSHSSYPSNYISLLVDSLFRLNADNVGGMLVTCPPDPSLKSVAIAGVLSSAFGVGNAYFRIGSKEVRKVDTVTFGCYRRSVFDRIGMFDEALLRNQDDEFNARLVQAGGAIYLVPEVKINYYTRDSLKALWRMYFQYGLFKPLVNVKLKRPASVRQFVPPAFVLFLILSIAGSFFSPWIFRCFIGGAGIYLVAALVFSVKTAREAKRYLLMLYLPWLFLLLHLAYGWGYLSGILKFMVLRREKLDVTGTR
jgi:glycosyltransferase involved in cell wall biosynthesis